MTTRFGVVGTAYWAREVHVPGVLAARDAKLVGIWGRNGDAARAIAGRHGIRAFERFEDLLAETEALTMAVPPAVQASLALRAADAARHMILEKPLATTAAEASAIAAAMAAHKARGLVFFLRRFVPEISAAIAAERGRGWRHATIRVHSAALSSPSPYAQSVWRQQEGASLWDIGPHVLSVLLPLLGPVTRIRAQPERQGVCEFHTEHEDGASADVSVTLRADPAAAGSLYRFASRDRELVLPEPDIRRADAFTLATGTLVEMIGGDVSYHECDIRTGAVITAILAAAENSARVGGVDVVPERQQEP